MTGLYMMLNIVTMLEVPVVSLPADRIVRISSRSPCLFGATYPFSGIGIKSRSINVGNGGNFPFSLFFMNSSIFSAATWSMSDTCYIPQKRFLTRSNSCPISTSCDILLAIQWGRLAKCLKIGNALIMCRLVR